MLISYIMYPEYEDHFKLLTNEELGQLIRDVNDYAFNGKEPKYNDSQRILAMAFSFMRVKIDKDKENYINTVEKNRENGKKGGRPKKTKEEDNPTVLEKNPKNPTVLNENPKNHNYNYNYNNNYNNNNNCNNNKNNLDDKVVTVYEVIENEFGRTISPFEKEIIDSWNYQDSIIKLAIKESVKNGACSIKYIDSIIKSWKKKNLKTMQEVKKYLQDYEERKTNTSSQSTGATYDADCRILA